MGSVVIIGGGIIGTSIAYHLRDSGRPVHLFEKDMLGGGTTAKSAAMLTHHQDTPSEKNHTLREKSWAWYSEKIGENRFSFEDIGTLHLAKSKDALNHIRKVKKELSSFGVNVELLSPGEIERFNLDTTSLSGGLLLPEDGVLDPGEIVQYFADRARAAGVKIHTKTPVQDIHYTADGVESIDVQAGSYDADIVINAAGPWANRVNDFVGLEIPLRHTIGPIVVLESEAEVEMPLMYFEEGIYLREEGDTQIFAGKFSASYEDTEAMDPNHAHGVEEQIYLDIAEISDRYLKAHPELQVSNEWVGLRTITPDNNPVLGESDIDGLYFAIGMNGFGVTLAPTIGQIFKSELLESGAENEFFPFQPGRF